MRYARDTIILKTRSEVKVTVTQKWYVTPCHPKMYLRTKIGVPISKNIGPRVCLPPCRGSGA